MATLAARHGLTRLSPNAYEKFLSVAALVLLTFVFAAIGRSHGQVFHLTRSVVGHLSTIIVALALTPVMLLRPRGDVWHRRLGRVWVAAMILTALISFEVRGSSGGGLSGIHVLSAGTLLMAPYIAWTARRHRVAAHRSAVRGMVTGALLIAGAFTFPFNRLLGHWLFA